jgi:hypothetical protein
LDKKTVQNIAFEKRGRYQLILNTIELNRKLHKLLSEKLS